MSLRVGGVVKVLEGVEQSSLERSKKVLTVLYGTNLIIQKYEVVKMSGSFGNKSKPVYIILMHSLKVYM